jgi:hypothetical protein
MKTFTIVLPVVTVSTILALFLLTGVLRDIQQAISRTIPTPGHKLRDFMLKHPRKKYGNEQLHSTRASGEQHSVLEYVTFSVELCFITIPVHEVREAVDLYGLRKRRPASSNRLGSTMSQRHLGSNSTITLEYRPDTGEGNAKSRVRQVKELASQLAERESGRRKLTLGAVRHARTILFIAIRILLLCLWIPLLLLEYVVLLFYCPFARGLTEPMPLDSHLRISKREQVKRFFISPLLFLGLDLSQFHTWRSRAAHEHGSPLPPTGPPDYPLAPLPQSYLYPDHTHVNRPPVLGREQHVRGAQRIRNAVAQPSFQAAYQQQYLSGPSPTAVPAQHSVYMRSHGYSNSRVGIPRRAGGISMDSERESAQDRQMDD